MESCFHPDEVPRAPHIPLDIGAPLPDYESVVQQSSHPHRPLLFPPAWESFLEPPPPPEATAQMSLEPTGGPDAPPVLVVAPQSAPETPSAVPETVTYVDRARSIVIRCPKLPPDLKYSWWTFDALDGDKIDELDRLWVQVGFFLHSPVYVSAYGDGNRPRPRPIKYYRDVSAALGRYLDGKPIGTFKNPHYQHTRFAIHSYGINTFTLRELSAMATTQTDRSRAGGQSKSPRKVGAARGNLAVAREVKHSADAERQERLLRYEAAGLTIKQIGEFEGISYDAARMAVKRAKAADERK